MDTRKRRSERMRVVMLPWIAHGHISPYLELAKRLTLRNFKTYLCSTPTNLNSIKKKIENNSHSRLQLVELHLPSSSELPLAYHTANGLPRHLMFALKATFETAAPPKFSGVLETLKPDLVLYDFNLPWAASVAASHKIPAVQFLVFGAVMASFTLHTLEKPANEGYPFQAINLSESQSHEMRKLLEETVNGVADKDRFREGVGCSRDIILIKTSTEIESKYLNYLSVLAGNKKVVPVGQLVEQDDVQRHDFNDDDQIIKWLDTKEKANSVVFVSFGTECFLSKEEIKEICLGLELSKVDFIWVIRFPVGDKTRVLEDELPVGFRERVLGGERGMVVEGWAPQRKILGHPNIGGFVSHCGWSSVMESMTMGVPIIGMPMGIDQPLNCRVVEDGGVGVEVRRDGGGKIKGEMIGEAIRKVMAEMGSERVRKKAKELGERLRKRGEKEVEAAVEELLQFIAKQ